MIIGLSGTLGSGKSTAVETLKQIVGEDNVVLVKFAGPLYDIQEMIYRRIASVYSKPEGFVKDRPLLQYLGTEWGRGKDVDLWIKLWKHDAEKALANGKIVVSDDTRFDNEAQTIKDLGGTIIKIDAPSIANRANVVTTGFTNHSSEAGIDKKYIDYIIKNDNTLKMYESSLKELFNKLVIRKEPNNGF